MRIKTKEDIEGVREIIGSQNAKACERALADGAQVWVFQAETEIEDDADLSEKEKEGCRRILITENLGYAGWFREPKNERKPDSAQILLGGGSSNYDTHGNYHGGGGGSRNESIH